MALIQPWSCCRALAQPLLPMDNMWSAASSASSRSLLLSHIVSLAIVQGIELGQGRDYGVAEWTVGCIRHGPQACNHVLDQCLGSASETKLYGPSWRGALLASRQVTGALCISSHYQSRYYRSKMTNIIRGENVCNMFLQSPCKFRNIMGIKFTVNSMCELLASCFQWGFLFLGEIRITNCRHIDSNGSCWLIETAWLHW